MDQNTAQRQHIGPLPQQARPITGEQLAPYMESRDWFMQLNFDGERRILKVDADSSVIATDSKGRLAPIPKALTEVALRLQKTLGAYTLDGTIVGEKLHVFDVLEVGGKNQRDKPAFDRYMMAWGLSPLLRENERKGSMDFSQAAWEPWPNP